MSRRTLLSSLLALVGCARHSLPPELTTAEAARSWVLGEVPVGSPIEDAQRLLQTHGCRCQSMTGADFAPQAPSGDESAWRGIDYVYCDLRQSTGLLQARRWQFALVERDGKLADVGVSTGLIGT
ncbi:hypothetical protein [Archangium lansingense]|uniref:Lipoprotein n=1 Tax=Archangium lansingense TaxID=2995310 RepID=A0ABT4ACT7_9BACT|nr:hypothetical protein [Archangium lansinium]MCY1078714.1 hypothetical protein [Archangium lansinium]